MNFAYADLKSNSQCSFEYFENSAHAVPQKIQVQGWGLIHSHWPLQLSYWGYWPQIHHYLGIAHLWVSTKSYLGKYIFFISVHTVGLKIVCILKAGKILEKWSPLLQNNLFNNLCRYIDKFSIFPFRNPHLVHMYWVSERKLW